ncbi:MAG: sensor domain-containing diguanylate cyclase, partial [Thermodesulfobacteriota bacterium]
WLTALFYCIFELVGGYRRAETPAQKDRIRYLLYGFVLTAMLSLTNTPAIYGYEIYPLGSFVFISLFLLAYGLFKYNMQLAAQQLRSVIFHIGHWSIAGSIALASALLLPVSSVGVKCTAGIVVAMLCFWPVQIVWNRVLNRFFTRSPNYLHKSYYELTYQLSGIHRLQSLYEITADWLFSIFMNCRCAMVFFTEEDRHFHGWGKWNPDYAGGFLSALPPLPDGDQRLQIADSHPVVRRLAQQRTAIVTRNTLDRWLSQDLPATDETDWIQHAGLLIPVYYRDQLTGLLIIGDKINDRSYARAEKTILSNLGIVLGPFIENANILEHLEKKVEKRTGALHDALKETENKNEQIAKKNELITRQNHVILSLFDTTTKIHDIETFDKLFSFILEQLHNLFPHLDFGLILEGGRSDILENGVFSGFTAAEQNRILAYRARLAEDNINGIMTDPKAFAYRGSPEAVQWTLLPMTMGDRRLGKMIIRGPAIDADTRRVISIFLSQVSAVAQNKLLMHRLEIIANTDGLTGAANRSYFEKQHERAIHNAARFENIHFSMLIIDINGLKTVNDTYGHAVGDEMLNAVAAALKSICRETDTLSRIGGDEFAILLPATQSREARRLLERIRDKENRLHLECRDADGRAISIAIRVSIGLAGSDETRPENVLKLADQRMYTNKEKFYSRAAP